MIDIVEWLRAKPLVPKKLEAADEIERLRARVAMLEEQIVPMRLDTMRDAERTRSRSR